MNVLTVYIFENVDEKRMLETAEQRAKEHPLKLQNVCYHMQGKRCNKKCFRIDLNVKER